MSNFKRALIALPFVLVGLVMIAIVIKNRQDARMISTSGLSEIKVKLTMLVDDWFHYWMLCAPLVANPMRSEGYPISCEKADYSTRYRKLANREIPLLVGTVDSYIIAHDTHKWQGLKVVTLDVSNGADALVGSKEFTNFDDIKGKVGLRVAYTPDSPSDTFRKALGVLYVPELFSTDPAQIKRAGTVFIKVRDSEEALKLLLEGRADLAFLWEPHVSAAVQENYNTIAGSDEVKGLIVDDLVAERGFAQKYPEAVKRLLYHYFSAMRYYREHPAEHVAYLQKVTDTKDPEAVKKMIAGIIVPSMADNCSEWFGVTVNGVQGKWKMVDSIDETVSLLRRTGDLGNNPLIRGDASSIIDNRFLDALCNDPNVNHVAESVIASGSVVFRKLSDGQWAGLASFGTLSERTISFNSGGVILNREGQSAVGQVRRDLARTPTFRLRIIGHTEPIPPIIQSDDMISASVKKSLERAQVVMNTLQVLGVPMERMQAVGRGPYEPVKCTDDESEGNCAARSRRVVFELLRERM